MRQIPLAIGPAPLATFDSFHVGDNADVVAHLQSLSAPAYLWGPSGAGKTHLLGALVHAHQRRGGRAGWFDPATPLHWAFDEAWSLLVLDAVEGFDAAQQRAAFALFIEAQTHGVPVAAAGRLPPVDLPLREDLRTRLGWGTVFAVAPLAESESRAVLRREADRRGIFLSDDVMDYLLTRFSRDLKHLMGLLDRLDRFALAEQRAVTVPLLRRMFELEGTEL
ncbi:MAG TPA: DnaA regulatory inactivator Hda [Burkholderiaceae bacterium]|nr:DnaA regulatory inactivator Hda [Burkholderiaceae bacterium]